MFSTGLRMTRASLRCPTRVPTTSFVGLRPSLAFRPFPMVNSFPSYHSLSLTQPSLRLKSTSTGGASAATPSDNVFELGVQLERQSEIIENIRLAKETIVEKQSTGRQLAINVSDEQARLDKHMKSPALEAQLQDERFERKQRFTMFVEKMLQLYRTEKKIARKQRASFAKMELAPVQSTTPIKACLTEYAKIATKGFDCALLAQSLKLLNQAVAASGNDPIAMNDLTLPQMDQNWRFDKVTEDIRFGLDPNPNVFFSPYNLAKVSRELGQLGYKNTDLMPLWFDKIDAMLACPGTEDYIKGASVSFDQAQVGGMLNYTSRHYIYQGFNDSQEFNEHVQTLIEYEQYKRDQQQAQAANKSDSPELAEVKEAAEKLIEAAKGVKDMQQEVEAAVRNVRNQYQRLKEAHDQHGFLQEHKYIHLDLLELQELLIKAGYLHPDEHIFEATGAKVGTLGMDAAVEVFYDMVLNFYPTALSPQYSDFYRAAMNNQPKREDKKDKHTELNIQTLSSTLVGLDQQALSYRRDIADRDYPTEFYEGLVLPEEKWLDRWDPAMGPEAKQTAQRVLSEHVRMERTYLNAWQTFFERTAKVPGVMEKMLDEGDVTLNDVLSSFRALNVCRFQARELRDRLGEGFRNVRQQSVDLQALVDGAVGIAGCSYKPTNAKQMVKTILNQLQSSAKNGCKRIDNLSFPQAVELLKALSTPGMPADDTDNMHTTISQLLQRLNSMHFDIIKNELTYNEFNQLYDCYVNLKYHNVKSLRTLAKSQFTDESLKKAFEQRQFAEISYPEHYAGEYDPVKPRVMGAFTQSLVKADLGDLHVMQDAQTDSPLYKDMFPYKPDLLMSHGGQKVGLFVLNDDAAMRDTHEPCGFTAGKMQLIRQAHQLAGKSGNAVLKGVPLALQSVVDANLREHRLQLKREFNIGEYLKRQGLDSESKVTRGTMVNTKPLGDFSANLTKQTVAQADTTSAGFEEFLMQLVNLLQKREKLDSVYEHEQVLANIDELKLQLLKLLSMHVQTLSVREKELVQRSLPDGFDSFDQLVTEGLVKPMSNVQANIAKEQGLESSKKPAFWQGTRQEVEMPIQDRMGLRPKSILPELLNQKFLWFEKYHQYGDWEEKMRQAYDQFNLMELPSKTKDGQTLYFDQNNFKRRVPKGIFPDGRKPRMVLRPPGNALEANARELESMHDEMTKFERSPMKQMVKTELARNAELASGELPLDVKAVTNLQNIKQSLKSDLTDHQICDYLFSKFSFTDRLIDAHLSKADSSGSQTSFLPRDAESYRVFLDEMQRQRIVSPYDQFYMKEAARKGNPEEIAAKLLELEQEYLVRSDEEYQQIKEKLEKEMEDLLLNYERANEDPFNLSHSLKNTVEVNIDVASLAPVRDRNDLGLRPTQLEMNVETFLKQQRCRAEANLIKARISYKVHSNEQLTKNEVRYLKTWIRQAQDTNTLLAQADVLVPSEPSTISLADALSPEDFYMLNSLPRVEISAPERERITLNDLVLELSLFVDNDTVRQVELGLLEENLKKEWELRDDFQLVNRRNKEIDLVMHEMEEVSWRAAGQFSDREKQQIEDLVFFDRGLDAFDNAFIDMDKASFGDFFDTANSYDTRMTLLENWLCRKDEEVRQRVNLPTSAMTKSDTVLNKQLEKPLRRARQKLVGQMLTTDEFGEARVPKQYNQLTSRELHLLVESLSVRLNLFQQKYPAFLPQVVKAVMEHRNLAESDRSMLDTYCKLFELDWRGDASVDNREQFMLTNPIYMNDNDRTSLNTVGVIDNQRVTKEIRQACQPYLPKLIAKMRELGKK